MIALALAHSATNVLCIGAHSDDVEIGAAGLIHRLADRDAQLRFTFIVVSGDLHRQDEARESASALVDGRATVSCGGFRDGHIPYAQPDAVKDFVRERSRSISPDLVLAPFRGDLHQDHAFVGSLAHQLFRENLILEYEIAKYDGDLGRPNVFVPLLAGDVDAKISHLVGHFPSQHSKSWYDEEAFRALMRLRGIECNSSSGYAEAFYSSKLVLDPK